MILPATIASSAAEEIQQARKAIDGPFSVMQSYMLTPPAADELLSMGVTVAWESRITHLVIYATFFNGGIRVFDIKDPFRPEEVAYFVPPVPEGADANGIHVDENGILYVTDRLKGGLYILELTV